MPYYALYYFRQATKLRPGDARFWCAMGQCYESEELNMQDSALRGTIPVAPLPVVDGQPAVSRGTTSPPPSLSARGNSVAP